MELSKCIVPLELHSGLRTSWFCPFHFAKMLKKCSFVITRLIGVPHFASSTLQINLKQEQMILSQRRGLCRSLRQFHSAANVPVEAMRAGGGLAGESRGTQGAQYRLEKGRATREVHFESKKQMDEL